MATLTGRTARSILPACDTPRNTEAVSRSPDGLSRTAAEAAWRAVAPSIAGTPHVRVSRDGGRTYPARHARSLPTEPPGQPCTVPVYDPGTGTGRLLALDLDPSRGTPSPCPGGCPPSLTPQAWPLVDRAFLCRSVAGAPPPIHQAGRRRWAATVRLRRLELRKAPDMPKAGPSPAIPDNPTPLVHDPDLLGGYVPDPEQKVNIRGHPNRWSHG